MFLVEVVRLLKPRFDGVVDLEVIVCRFDFAGVSNNSSGISFKKRDGRFACERQITYEVACVIYNTSSARVMAT